MLHFWLPVYAICALYLLAAVLWPLLPCKLRRHVLRGAIPENRQTAADRLFRRALLQFAVLFAAVDFMLMRTLCLTPEKDQQLAAAAAAVLQIAAVLLIPPSVQRGLRATPSNGQGSTVTERANAKVNLTLAVGAKRPDGYHEVETVMTAVDLFDTVTVSRHPGIRDELICDPPVTERPEDNLCVKALRVFFQELGVKEDFVTITLQKRIPTQAGLGGGSSDAAAVLRGLRTLYAPDMTDTRLEEMAAELGSDVPYFIRGGTTAATGRGERLAPLPPMPECWFVIVKPEESHSTAAMYAAIDRAEIKRSADSWAVRQGLAAGDLRQIAAGLSNDFQQVLPEGSAVPAIVRSLREQEALNAQMTGSGSAVFGLFRDRENAEAAAGVLKGTYPHTFCVQQV